MANRRCRPASWPRRCGTSPAGARPACSAPPTSATSPTWPPTRAAVIESSQLVPQRVPPAGQCVGPPAGALEVLLQSADLSRGVPPLVLDFGEFGLELGPPVRLLRLRLLRLRRLRLRLC